MFWTTNNVTEKWDAAEWELDEAKSKADMTRWDAYVDVCSGIVPSWADGIKRAD